MQESDVKAIVESKTIEHGRCLAQVIRHALQKRNFPTLHPSQSRKLNQLVSLQLGLR